MRQSWLGELRRVLRYVGIFIGLFALAAAVSGVANGLDPSRIESWQIYATWAFAAGGTWLYARYRGGNRRG